MADPHDAILEALRLHHVGDISRSEMIGQLVALCEGRYQSGLEDAAKLLESLEGTTMNDDDYMFGIAADHVRALADK